MHINAATLSLNAYRDNLDCQKIALLLIASIATELEQESKLCNTFLTKLAWRLGIGVSWKHSE